MDISPNSNFIALGGGDLNSGFLSLLNIQKQKIVKSLVNIHGVKSVSFSPDGKTLALRSSGDITIWSLFTFAQAKAVLTHDDSVDSMCFSPDGKTLVSGSYDNKVKLWNLDTCRMISTLRGHNG